jgi:protein phosphatase
MLRASQSTCKTDTGRQRRENEDSAFARAPLFVVADGMGGAQAGEVASRLAVEAFEAELPEAGTPEERLADRAQDANRRIYEISRTEHERAGMGTTLTAVYVDESRLSVAHVGDSRAYLFRKGELGRLTQDHTLVEELVKRGKLTEEQAAEHPQRSIITRALGVDPQVEVDTRTFSGHAGDVVMLCSDGLTSMISEPRIASVLKEESDLERAAERLVADANDAGGRDNITVILFRLEEVGGSAAGGDDQPTMIGLGSDGESSQAAPATAGTLTASREGVPVAAAPGEAEKATRPAPLARTQGRRPFEESARRRGPRRFARPLAALLAALIVIFLVGGGGYLASRQLFFVGTNAQGIVTVYRGLPYELPLGLKLYENVYVSGAPLRFVPAIHRHEFVDHQLRSQADAINLVHAAELGQLSK